VTFRTDLAPATAGRGDDEEEESKQFWRMPVSHGDRVAVAVNTTQPPAVDTLNLGEQEFDIRFAPTEDPALDTDGEGCENQMLWDNSGAHPNGMVTEGAVTRMIGSDRCQFRELLISVTRGGDWKADEDVPAEITVTRFGAVADAGNPVDNTIDSHPRQIPMPTGVQQVTPGTWYDTAAEVPADGSSAVEATIVPGEQKFFRVPVGYGQTLDTALDVTDAPEAGDFSIGDELDLDVRNGARQLVRTIGEATTGGSLDVHAEESRWDSFSAPVNFGNRFGGENGTGDLGAAPGSMWLGGEQYIVVTLERSFADAQIDENSRQIPVTFRLAAKASGQEQDGPGFAPLEWSGERTTGQTAPAEEGKTVAASDDSDDGGVPWTLIGIIAVVVVALGAVGALVLRRR
jgi:hypothetical protein